MTAKTQVQPNKSLRCYLRDVYSLQLLKKQKKSRSEEIQDTLCWSASLKPPLVQVCLLNSSKSWMLAQMIVLASQMSKSQIRRVIAQLSRLQLLLLTGPFWSTV